MESSAPNGAGGGYHPLINDLISEECNKIYLCKKAFTRANIAPLAQEIILDYAKITTHPKFVFLKPEVVIFAKGNASEEDDPIGHLATVQQWSKVIEEVINDI